MNKKKEDDTYHLALIEIQHRIQRPMSADDATREFRKSFPDRDDKILQDNGHRRPVELWKLGIFVMMPKMPDSVSGKHVIHYGLPQYCPKGLLFTQAFEVVLNGKLELLAAMMATTMSDTLWDRIGRMGLKDSNGKDLEQEDLKIDPKNLKDINYKTLLRLRIEHLPLVTSVAKEIIPDELLGKENDDSPAS
jgi:hypothetical protein